MSYKKTRSEIRQERYNRARREGFNSQEANKIKDWGDARINDAIREKQRETARIARNEARRDAYKSLRESGYTPAQASKLRSAGKDRLVELLQEIVYSKPSDTLKNYASDYTYVIRYETKDKDKKITEKFIHITSKTKMTRGEVMAEALEIFADSANESMYEGEAVILSSITIVAAYQNE